MSSSTGTIVFNDSRIKATGVIATESIGVGTANPTSNLHVVGDASIQSNLEVGTANLFVDTTTGNVGVGTANPTSNLHVVGNASIQSNLEVGTANLFVDTTTGNVGIGTDSPGGNLEVAYKSASGLADGTIRIGNYSTSSTYGENIYSLRWSGQLGMGPYPTAKGIWSRQGLAVHVHENEEYSIKSSNWTNLFGVKGGTGDVYAKGNVGIGTTNPAAKLDVNGYMLNNNPVFHAYLSGAGDTTTLGVFNSFTSTYINRGGHYYTSGTNQGKFIAPVAGVYHFSANMLHRQRGANGSAEITFYKNGTNVGSRGLGYTYVSASSDHDNFHIELTIELAVNDYIQVAIHSLASNTDFYVGYSLANFRGFLIG